MSTTAPDAPDALAARLRALIDAGPPQARRGETGAAAADRLDATRRREDEIAALRQQLSSAFAEARGWSVTAAPLAVKELARRASPGGNWHKPAQEWLGSLFALGFYRDGRRRACAAVAHPLAAQVDQDRDTIAAWASERELVATFPGFPSWHDPVRSVLVVFEPATALKIPAPAAAPPTVPDLDALLPDPLAAGGPVQGKSPATRPQPAPAPSAPTSLAGGLVPPALAAMRPVAPIDLGAAVPRDLADEANPDWQIVDPTTLLIDEA